MNNINLALLLYLLYHCNQKPSLVMDISQLLVSRAILIGNAQDYRDYEAQEVWAG